MPNFEFLQKPKQVLLVVRRWKLRRLLFTVNAVETAGLELKSEVELASVEREKEIARYAFVPLTVMVGPVPVVFVPVLTVSVGVDGDIHVGVTAKVEQEAEAMAGVWYADETWRSIDHLSNEFHYSPPRLSAGLGLKGYTSGNLSLLLYGLTGPYAEVDAYLELEADVFDDPWWTLYGGLDASAGAKVEVLGRSLADYESPQIIGYRVVLAQAQSNDPPNMPFSPHPGDDRLVQDLDVQLGWSGGDLDGDVVTYDVYLEANDPTPDALVSDDQIGSVYDPGGLKPNARYYWRVVAKDEHGATTAGPVWTFATVTDGTCPIEIALETPLVSGLRVIINGSASSGCSTITRLNWRWGDGLSDDQWFPASHAYAASGTYSITVTAYNDLGGAAAAATTARVRTAFGETVTVPAGEFLMGCDQSNQNEHCYSREQPLHTVHLDEYAMDRHEVTNGQYAECVAAGQCDPPELSRSSTRDSYYNDSAYDDYPVIYVSWYDARDYCAWVGKRLPTEAEWEKAARGSGDTRMYPWGNEDPDCSRLNYHDLIEGRCVGDTTAVGSYPSGASPYGALDMAGNVWEWVADWYHEDYYDSAPYGNPPGPESGDSKVLRGGPYNNNWQYARVAFRNPTDPDDSFSNVGFRCVGVAPGQ